MKVCLKLFQTILISSLNHSPFSWKETVFLLKLHEIFLQTGNKEYITMKQCSEFTKEESDMDQH